MSRERIAVTRIRVWDAPTRISHWCIVTLFVCCWWTANADLMHWHRICGYCMLAAVVFRLCWGFAGAQTARFVNFVRSPAEVWRYLRKPRELDQGLPPSDPIGHNPLGGLSILAMLGLLMAQAVLGLLSVNVDGTASGPWSRWLSFDAGRRMARLHAANFDLLLALIAVHLCAIAFYAARGTKLLPAMIHGYKLRAIGESPPHFVSARRAVCVAIAVSAAVAFLVLVR